MKNSQIDKIASCKTLIEMIEREEQTLRKSIAAKKLNYKGRYTNLIGYKTFFEDHEFTKESAALDFDLMIVEKAIGKKAIKHI